MIGRSLGSTAVGILAGFACGLLVAAVIVAGRLGAEQPAPVGVTVVPAVTASIPVTVTGIVSVPTTVTQLRSSRTSTTTTETTVVTSTEISTTSATPTTSSMPAASEAMP
ncbi:MAG: hypothetical protein QOI21_2860 [Actinomycetota bacterium]|nr:hypothetical protein [Actinomycetota bacterium]